MKLSPPAKPVQSDKFLERRNADQKTVIVNGHQLIALPNVYDTSTDTELMADSVEINIDETFVEIGCGTGAITLLVSQRAKSGLGVDINPEAIRNAELNRTHMNIDNVTLMLSDVFDSVDGFYNVVICNPPYNNYKPVDEVEMMFWDEDDQMKRKFFKQVMSHLLPGGKVYFGWGDFEDLDQELPLKLAEGAGLTFIKKHARLNSKETRTYFVFEFHA